MTSTTAVSELTSAQITFSLDAWDRLVVVLPDEIAARLAISSHEEVRNYGYGHFESRRFDTDTYETRAIKVMFEAILAENPDERGLSQYERFGTGYFYGWIVGTSGWNSDARTWKDYEVTKHLHVDGIHLDHHGCSHFGS